MSLYQRDLKERINFQKQKTFEINQEIKSIMEYINTPNQDFTHIFNKRAANYRRLGLKAMLFHDLQILKELENQVF